MTALRAVFVDTGAWVALRYRRDQHHGQARRLLRRLRADGLGLVATEWVLAMEEVPGYRSSAVGVLSQAPPDRQAAILAQLGRM